MSGPTKRVMAIPAKDVAAWLRIVQAKHKWSKARAASELGASRAGLDGWLVKGAPHYIGLAMAALLVGLHAYPNCPIFTSYREEKDNAEV